MMGISELTTKLVSSQSTVMEIPNEQVGNVLNEIIQYIVQDSTLLELLNKEMVPDLKQPLAPDPQKVVRKVVGQVREGKDLFKCVPATIGGQRYFLQQIISWISQVQ
jgi:hypothetical protein